VRCGEIDACDGTETGQALRQNFRTGGPPSSQVRSDVARIEGRASEDADVVGRLAARPDGGGAHGAS
jgi:hypothetical protein